MPSIEGKQSTIAHLFLSLYEKNLAEKNVEIPKLSRGILGLAVNEAVNQYVTIRDKDPSIDPLSVLETTFMLSLRLFRLKNPPIILVRTFQASFKTEKKSPYSIVVVQPSTPSLDQYDEKINQNGKLLIIKKQAIEGVKTELLTVIKNLKEERVDFICFPELYFLNEANVYEILSQLGNEKDCFIIAGSYHDEKSESNVSVIFSPEGKWFNQSKIFKALGEGIKENPIEYLNVVDFLNGRFCVLICIDSEREVIREILKETLETGKCPLLVFNPSHTDHPRRSVELLKNNLMLLLSAAIVFCNTNKKGGSTILVPLLDLKEKGFKIFDLPPATKTGIGKAKVDIELLAKHRTSKQKGVVSMVR